MSTTDKDQELLDLLRENARASITELSERMGVSRSTVQKRLDRLHDEGVISGYTVVLSPEYEASVVKAHVSIVVSPKRAAGVVKKIKTMAASKEIYSVSGSFDLVVMLEASSIQKLDAAIDEIIAIDGVERTVSSVILSTKYVSP